MSTFYKCYSSSDNLHIRLSFFSIFKPYLISSLVKHFKYLLLWYDTYKIMITKRSQITLSLGNQKIRASESLSFMFFPGKSIINLCVAILGCLENRVKGDRVLKTVHIIHPNFSNLNFCLFNENADYTKKNSVLSWSHLMTLQ